MGFHGCFRCFSARLWRDERELCWCLFASALSVLTITSPNDPGSRACFLAPSTPSPSADASVIGWIWPTPEPYHWPQRRLCLGQYRETRQKLPILVAGSKFARLAAGGNRIRTIGSAEKETASRKARGRSSRLARRPVLNDPIQLIGPASLVGNSRETFHKSGTDGSNSVPSFPGDPLLPRPREELKIVSKLRKSSSLSG